MKILYGYSNCSQKKYDELIENLNIMVLQQDQKYHTLLIDGLNKCDAELTCISGLPINRNVSSSLYIKPSEEKIEDVKYHYFSSINLPIFRQLGIMMKSYFYTKKYIKQNPESVIILDVLFPSVALGMLYGARRSKNKKIGIITDIPHYFEESNKSSNSYKRFAYTLKNLDAYLLLTDEMKKIVNKENKPYVVIEGQADRKSGLTQNSISDKYKNKVFMYAGSIHKRYGIEVLTQAFMKADIKDAELHIYGDGDYKEELEKICGEHPAIKYFGIKPNAVIVEEEQKASVLVNPRPTAEEFTKYSFPSKNMEYMASGTPLLCTRLPGMPSEYYDYIYTIDDESVAQMALRLKEISKKAPEELFDFGMRAKKFILDEKNNVKQAEKLLKLIKEMK